MTEKNVFAYKLFLSLNISGFSSFLCSSCKPPEKVHSPVSQQSPLNMRSCQAPSFWKFVRRFNLISNRKGGVHIMVMVLKLLEIVFSAKNLSPFLRFIYIHLKCLLTFYQKMEFCNAMNYCFRYIRFWSRKVLPNFWVSILLDILIPNISWKNFNTVFWNSVMSTFACT